jgi:choline-sulfatase
MRAVRDAGYCTSVFGKIHLHPHRGDLRDREDLVRSWGLDHVDEIAGPRAATRCKSNLTDRWKAAGVYDAYRADLRDRYATKPWVARPSPLPLKLYADVYVGEQAAAYLRTYSDSRPWCCWVSFGGPHEPWDAPEPYASLYEPESMPEPIRRVADTHERPQGLLDQKLARGGFPFEPGDVARLRANYAGNVTLIDDQISEILKVVEQRGDLERTVIAFVSDHGEMNGDHQLLYKQNFLDPAARVPLIMRLPRTMAAPSGAISNAMVELMDVGATLVEIAGGDPVEGSRASSLLPIMKDPSRSHREVVLSELRQEAMVASASWKLAVNQGSEIYILYDLEADARERHNLAGLSEYSAVAADLYECLRQRADEGGRAPRRESPKRQSSKNAIREKLRPRRRDARR